VVLVTPGSGISNLMNERGEIDLKDKTPAEVLEIYTLIKSKVEKE
jgi:hypothetical protein